MTARWASVGLTLILAGCIGVEVTNKRLKRPARPTYEGVFFTPVCEVGGVTVTAYVLDVENFERLRANAKKTDEYTAKLERAQVWEENGP